MQNISVKAVLFQENDWWVGQCLEHDIVAQAKSVKGLIYEINKAIIGHIVVCTQEGLEPFTSLPKAPARYWKMFGEGVPLQPIIPSLDLPNDFPIPAPELRLAA